MFRLLKNCEIYSPDYQGVKDVLVFENKIVKVDKNIKFESKYFDCETLDLDGSIMTPGFIDQHVHILGGGGEGGFATRTPEVALSHVTTAGITTVVGLLGTDNTTRHLTSLLAKARGLEKEGISAYIYTGSYQVPASHMTQDVKSDIILIDKVIGVGEIAISDHRSSNPTNNELLKLVSQARLGGMLSDKAGVVHTHVGEGRGCLNQIFEVLDMSDIPITQFVPTHLNRSKRLIEDAVKFGLMGGLCDITASINLDGNENDSVSPSEALDILLSRNVDINNITMSSDGNGSAPIFDDKGKLVAMGIGSLKTLYVAFKNCVTEMHIPIEKVLPIITSNVSRILKLKGKGIIKEGYDADIVIMNKNDLKINIVMAGGNIMVKSGIAQKFGTFEKNNNVITT